MSLKRRIADMRASWRDSAGAEEGGARAGAMAIRANQGARERLDICSLWLQMS
jgi:hypothetical protein